MATTIIPMTYPDIVAIRRRMRRFRTRTKIIRIPNRFSPRAAAGRASRATSALCAIRQRVAVDAFGLVRAGQQGGA